MLWLCLHFPHLPAEALARFHTGGYILECLPSALYCFLFHEDHPERALLTAANGGFDAATGEYGDMFERGIIVRPMASSRL